MDAPSIMPSTNTESPAQSGLELWVATIAGWLKSRALAVGVVAAVLYFLAALGQINGLWSIPFWLAISPIIAVFLLVGTWPGLLVVAWWSRRSIRRSAMSQTWSRVHGVELARRVRVKQRDGSTISGIFASSSADCLTIELRDGTTRRIERGEVRELSVSQAFLRRRETWGLTALAVCGTLVASWAWQDFRPLVLLVAFILACELSHKLIYAVPPPK